MSITLQAVTVANWQAIAALAVAPEQQAWVAPNSLSLLEANYGFAGELAHLRLIPLAIALGTTPIGFALYNVDSAFEHFYIMRFMIDHGHQGHGYGRAALDQLLALFRAHPQAKEVAVGYTIGNQAAQRLYASCGFAELRPDEAGEMLMWQALNPQAHPWESIWNPAYRPV